MAGALPFLPPAISAWPGGTVALDEKGIAITAPDRDTKLAIGGRLHLDAGAASLRPRLLGPALSAPDEIRRAWLEPTLTLPGGVVANLQYDFSETPQPINNLLLAYRGREPFIITVGNFKEPFSLEQLISNNNTLFTERALLDAFAPSRNFGAAVGAHGERWTAVAGVFGGNINTDLDRNGIAGTARLTYAPVLTDGDVVHVGVAGSYRALDPSGTALSFDATPEDDLFSTSLVDTGTLRNAADVGRLGVEALAQWGGARVVGEYVLTAVGGRGGLDTRLFQAGYLEAALVLNGEGPGRPYELVPPHGSEYAVLGGVKVPDGQRLSNGGIGVFELGARVSAISLQDGGTRGGREIDGTLGLNWYPDRDIRVMADYVHAHADPAAHGLGDIETADSDLFVGRLQFAW